MAFAIELRDVAFAYGARRVLEGIDLSVERGEMVGIIGPNGSGKSTLLRLMGGVLRPAAGEIRIEERRIEAYGRRELAQRIAAVAQETAIDFPFSVAEVVLMGRAPHLGGRLFESARDLAVAEQAMRRTGVLDLADRRIHELSGGERQRVILARALAQEAPILLLDEPTTFLDIRHQVEVYDLLRELQSEGYAAVAALHDLNMAALYCQRLVLLKAGRILRVGTPEEVITPESVRAAYEADVDVRRNEHTGALSVLPLRRRVSVP